MTTNLSGMHVAIVATDGFEQSELKKPLEALRKAGAAVEIVSPKNGRIQGMEHHEKGDKVAVDRVIDRTDPQAYDALVLPGGVANPDTLRIDEATVEFIRHFVQSGKPIAAICHGPWTLIEAGGVNGKTMTSWPSLRTDLCNAGAGWVNREVVRDGMLVTSRKPDDLPAFCDAMIAMIAESAAKHSMAAE